MLTVQDCLGGKELPQVVVLAKSLGFAPVIVMPVIERVATMLALVKVTTFEALVVPTFCAEKRTLVGENDAAVPVPCSDAVCGDPGPLSETDNVAVRVLIDWGVNAMLITQLPFEGRLDPHVLVCVKSLAFVPVKVIEEMATAASVLLLKVTGCEALLFPRTPVLKVRLVGESTKEELSRTETMLLGAVGCPPMVTTKSGLPSPFKSPA